MRDPRSARPPVGSAPATGGGRWPAPRSQARPRFRAALRWLERGLWSVAIVTILWLGYVGVDRVVFDRRQPRASSALAAPVSTAESAVPVPLPIPAAAPLVARQALAPGEPIGRLEIPSVGISTIVAGGTDKLTLRRGVGHIDGTALPGEPGNVGLAGHRDTVFRGLRKLRPADRIFLATADGSFEYVVEELSKVLPERSDVLDPTGRPTLTLVTCYPFDFVGPAPLRFIVRARQVSRAPAGSAAPRAVSTPQAPQAPERR